MNDERTYKVKLAFFGNKNIDPVQEAAEKERLIKRFEQTIREYNASAGITNLRVVELKPSEE